MNVLKCGKMACNKLRSRCSDKKTVLFIGSYWWFHKPTATIALQKLSNHLWFISETLVPLSLFDDRITPEIKRVCVQNLIHKIGVPKPPVRLTISTEECSVNFCDLFSPNGKFFF